MLSISFAEKTALYFKAFQKQSAYLMLLLFLATLFIGVGLLLFAPTEQTTETIIIGSVFFIVGCALILFLLFSLPAQITRSYRDFLIEKYGQYHNIRITELNFEHFVHRRNDTRQGDGEGEIKSEHFIYHISIQFLGQTFSDIFELPKDKLKLGDKLKPGLEIPVRIIPDMPEGMRIAREQLLKQLESDRNYAY